MTDILQHEPNPQSPWHNARSLRPQQPSFARYTFGFQAFVILPECRIGLAFGDGLPGCHRVKGPPMSFVCELLLGRSILIATHFFATGPSVSRR